MTLDIDLRVEWLEAPDVTTPELAATWARYELWVGDRCVTQVEEEGGNLRRAVYGSLYPLAYWVATNWWLLTSHIRPSEVETTYWTWPNVGTYPWLRQHNMRGAGDGMAWPNLTLVNEGSIARVTWAPDAQDTVRPVRFVSGGRALIQTDSFLRELIRIVDNVLDRLQDQGLPKTPLAEEWEAIVGAGAEEVDFCKTVARLGLDPYSVSDQITNDVMNVASSLPPEVVSDFFDSADPAALLEAAQWTRRAMTGASRATTKARERISVLHESTLSDVREDVESTFERPWEYGYAMARQLRSARGIETTDAFDVSPWVGLSDVSAPSNGIQGFVAVEHDQCGLVSGMPHLGITGRRFSQARALGRVLARPSQRNFVLSAAHGDDERIARAFAAELLAPAEGIRQCLDVIGKQDYSAMEAIASRFKVSSWVIWYQYDNQIAIASNKINW
jgi:hypothetical protein